MKKLGVLVAVAVLLGCASSAFAQGSAIWDAKTTGMAWAGAAPAYTKDLGKKLNENALVSKIKALGEKVSLVYTLTWAQWINGNYGPGSLGLPKKMVYPSDKPSFSGYSYTDTDKNLGYLLISRTDWDNMKDEYPSFWHSPVILEHEFALNTGTKYTQKGSKGLNSEHHTVNGKKYTIITIDLSSK